MTKKITIITVPAASQAYVMPDEPDVDELTDEELEALPEAEQEKLWQKKYSIVGEDGFNTNSDRGDGDDDGIDWDNLDLRTDTEKAAAPIIEAAGVADLLEHMTEESRPVDVDLSGETTKTLLVAVWHELRGWKKQPKPEVIAKAVGLAIAKARGEKGLKHPRDLAKEVSVRPKTFFQVLNIADAEIARLGLSNDLRENGNL